MESYYTIEPADLIELEFANLLMQIQQHTIQQEPEQVSSDPSPSAPNNSGSRTPDHMEDEFPLISLLNFLEEFGRDLEQDASEPSSSDVAPSPKKSKLTDHQPSTSQNVADSCVPPTTTTNTVSRERTLDDTSEDLDLLQTVYGEDFTMFLEESVQETEDVASEPINLCPKRTKASDYQPCSDQLMASPSSVPSTAKRKENLEGNKPYIKKPLNAFMLFRAEQKHRVAYELDITDYVSINKELGRRWKLLSEEEQAPYFQQALRERRAHQAKYPDWSCKNNFGKKVKHRNIAAPNDDNVSFPANQQWPHGTAPTSFPPQGPYYQHPHYQPWGPSQGPRYQPGGPSQGPYNQPWGPSKEPSRDTVTTKD